MDLNLLDAFFQLDCNIITTPYVISEIIRPDQFKKISQYIENNKLNISEDSSFISIQTLYNECPGLSIADCSVLELSLRKNGIIISNDKRLYNESKKRNLKVKGLLWVIRELINEMIISKKFALEKLKLYPEINQRAPRQEILVFISKLEIY